jgi:probable phosphoglycerate mutase
VTDRRIEVDSTQTVPQPTLLRVSDADTCEVLLIRHGRSADVVPGGPQSADPPLHDIGVQQAAALAARLAPLELHGVYSSHLARAMQTAQPLADQRGLQLETDVDLEEIRLGDWSYGEFRRRAAAADPEFLAWAMTGRWDGVPGSEGDDGLRSRVALSVSTLAERHRGQRIAIVVHGGVINAYISHLLDVHRSLWMAVENTSITLVRLHKAAFPTVVTINDCHHLYDPILATPA